MNTTSSIEQVPFSHQINLFDNPYNIFDSALLNDLNEVTNKKSRIRHLASIARISSHSFLENVEDFDQIADEELMTELEYLINEFTNEPTEILVVLLLLLEDITTVWSEEDLDSQNLNLFSIVKGLIEMNYDMQVDLDIQSLAA